MNTPDTNKNTDSLDNSLVNNNTPDTEEKKHVAYSPEVNQIRPILVKYFNEYPADLLADLSDLLSSRDTYWKERVRKEVEVLQERFGDWDNGDENEPLLLKCEVLGILDNLK